MWLTSMIEQEAQRMCSIWHLTNLFKFMSQGTLTRIEGYISMWVPWNRPRTPVLLSAGRLPFAYSPSASSGAGSSSGPCTTSYPGTMVTLSPNISRATRAPQVWDLTLQRVFNRLGVLVSFGSGSLFNTVGKGPFELNRHVTQLPTPVVLSIWAWTLQL